MSMRLAAYAVCIRDRHLLLVQVTQPCGTQTWTLPGGGVEQSEDPIDTVVREIAEETGYQADVLALLGVDSRVIPETEAWSGQVHQNIGIFYEVQVTEGAAGAELHHEWVPLEEIENIQRSSLIDVSLSLHHTRPDDGHTSPVQVGGKIWH